MTDPDKALKEAKKADSSRWTRVLIGFVVDADTMLGFLLAGAGESQGSDNKSRNFILVKDDTSLEEIEDFLAALYQRKNIGVILIASDIYKKLGHVIHTFNRDVPILLEIPTKTCFLQMLEIKERERLEHDQDRHEHDIDYD